KYNHVVVNVYSFLILYIL
ncbi:hypothetical protein, partial [Plasmodium yoelii yoelii]